MRFPPVVFLFTLLALALVPSFAFAGSTSLDAKKGRLTPVKGQAGGGHPRAGRTRPVYVFNAGQSFIRVAVNGGKLFLIDGAGSQNFTPKLPAIPPDFGEEPDGNRFGYGRNDVTTIVDARHVRFTIDIPEDVRVTSLQLYLFPQPGKVRWMLLNDTEFVTSGESR